jgi:cobalt/nickel transport system permease protein
MQLSLDRYAERASRIHRLDPRVKVCGTLLLIMATVSMPDGAWAAFLVAWVVTLAVAAYAHLGMSYALRRSFIALPFLLAAVTLIFTLPGRPMLTIPLGPWTFTASDAGLVRFGSIALRSWVAVQAAILLTATTRFPDLMHALRHLRVPALIVAIVGFMYRYLAVLSEEAQRLLRARDSRSAGVDGRRGGGSLLWRARVAGNMAGQLFLRSYERSERIYSAMQARGYAGEFLTINPHVMRSQDWVALALTIVAALTLQLIARAL